MLTVIVIMTAKLMMNHRPRRSLLFPMIGFALIPDLGPKIHLLAAVRRIDFPSIPIPRLLSRRNIPPGLTMEFLDPLIPKLK